jgi:hypothetical protein
MTKNQQSLLDENLFEHIYLSRNQMQRLLGAMSFERVRQERVSQLGMEMNCQFLNLKNEPKLPFSFMKSKPCFSISFEPNNILIFLLFVVVPSNLRDEINKLRKEIKASQEKKQKFQQEIQERDGKFQQAILTLK